MHGTGVYANPVALMLGAELTAGFVRPGDDPSLLDLAFPMPTSGHQIHRLLAFTSFLGAPPLGATYDFPLRPEDREEAECLLRRTESPLIGLHAGSWDDTKRWRNERFATVGGELQRRYGGTVVLIGGRRERTDAEQIERTLGRRCLNLVGRTSLGVLGAVIARLAVFVSNDSGPAHIAYAMQIPSVTIFGAMDPAEWGPVEKQRHAVLAYDVECRPCSYTQCPIDNRCLDGVTADHVIAAAERVLPVRAAWSA